MKNGPDTPMGTVVLITIFAVLTLALWFNAYFIVLSRGAN
jgi:sensor domain CHASE-containing protein